MTFEELLDQAIAMLQRRGRVTYGALKRQFGLDDAYLEDLKAEIIKGQRLAVDEDGEVLVWMGGGCVSHLRQDKLYIKENEGILHEVKISPAAYRRDVPCSCP